MLKKLIISIVLLLSVVPLQSSPALAINTKPNTKPIVYSTHESQDNTIMTQIIKQWQSVAICEEGGNWKYFSYWYPDALGIDRPNWIQFGGSIVKPSSEIEQIIIAVRFIKYYKTGIPDQYGCHSW